MLNKERLLIATIVNWILVLICNAVDFSTPDLLGFVAFTCTYLWWCCDKNATFKTEVKIVDGTLGDELNFKQD